MDDNEGTPASVLALNASLTKLEAAQDRLDKSITEVNAATKDVNQALRNAQNEIKSLAGDQVRKMLAKEFERYAQGLRQK